MDEYRVWVRGEEFRVNAGSRYQAAARGVRMYLVEHPKSPYNWSQLMTVVRTKRMKLDIFAGL